MRKYIGKAFFKVSGWTLENNPAIWSDKQVAIGFEHTSNFDAVLALALVQAIGIKNPRTLVKKELFKGPFKLFFEALGCIPVDRKAAKAIVGQMVNEFAAHEQMTLMLAPEATRGKDGTARQPIKTGFWQIAKAANVSIVLMYANPLTQQCGAFAKIVPSDLQADLLEIQRLYQEKGLTVVIPQKDSRLA